MIVMVSWNMQYHIYENMMYVKVILCIYIRRSFLLNPMQPSLWHLWHCLTCLSRCCCGGRCRGDMSQALGISGASKRSKGKCFFVNGYPTPLKNCSDVCFKALCGECVLDHFAICLCFFSSPLLDRLGDVVNLASCKLQMSCWRCNWNGWRMWWCCPYELMKQVPSFQELSRPPIR